MAMNNKKYTAPTAEIVEINADVITSSREWDTPEIPINTESRNIFEW
jgi:hypothetical protein